MNRASQQAQSHMSILDRPLGRPTRAGTTNDPVVSLSFFAYMFSEMVQYHQNRVDSIHELERRLEATGYGVGLRVLELLAYRSREYKRETKLMNMLQFVSTHVWKALFGKAADSLERSIDHEDEFMIVDYSPITSTFVSVPADFGGLSVDSYISGIIAGTLEGADFSARVTAHTVALEDGEAIPASAVGGSATISPSSSAASSSAMAAGGSLAVMNSVMLQHIPSRREKTVFLVKFAPAVLARDNSSS